MTRVGKISPFVHNFLPWADFLSSLNSIGQIFGIILLTSGKFFPSLFTNRPIFQRFGPNFFQTIWSHVRQERGKRRGRGWKRNQSECEIEPKSILLKTQQGPGK